MAATIGFILRPLCISISRFHSKIPIIQKPIPSSSSFSSFSSLTSPQIQSLSITYSSNSTHNDSYPSSVLQTETEQYDDRELESEAEIEEHDFNDKEDDEVLRIENGEEEGSPMNLGSEVGEANTVVAKNVKLPNLSVKEKKELASYAHGLGKKLKSQLVGKSGVTDNVISSFLETLEANELLKIKFHRSCPGELEDEVSRLEQGTGSVVVSKIGRTVIVYKPSITKMKAEEKKKEFQRAFIRRQSKPRPDSMKKVPSPRFSGRGRRGTSKVEY